MFLTVAIWLQIYDLFLFVGTVVEKDDDPGDFFHAFGRYAGSREDEFWILSALFRRILTFKFLILKL